MDEKPDSQPRRARRAIATAAKADFVAALRAGTCRDQAAAAAGHTPDGFYYARRKDPLFALAWAWARELSGADQHAAARAAAARLPSPDCDIAPNANRILQRRPRRRMHFDDRRKRLFLDYFAGTADAYAAADHAGVSYSAVTAHHRKDAAFAAAWDEALAIAYALLEAEAVRQRLEAQKRLRELPSPTGEMAQEFDRVIKLLSRYHRRNGGAPAMRRVGAGRERAWSFDEAMYALEKKLNALGIRRGLLPAPPIELGPAPDGGNGPAPDGGNNT